MAKTKNLLECSFCTKSQRSVKKLIAGPGVYICDECIALCNEIIAEEENDDEHSQAVLGQGLADMDTDALITNLESAATVSQSIDRRFEATVLELRKRGLTWAKIGEILGISRQAAWERFADDE